MARRLSTAIKAADFAAMSRLSADIDLSADGKATGFVRVPHSVHRSAYGWIPIPIVRIRNGEGPSVLMQAGTHGDEWEGQIGLGNLIRALEPKDIKGRLVILPSANFPAAMAGQRTSPIDEGNLNRSIPATPKAPSPSRSPTGSSTPCCPASTTASTSIPAAARSPTSRARWRRATTIRRACRRSSAC